FRTAVDTVAGYIRDRKVDVVVGFGGYASAPAYLAARREKVPLAIHEANARAGIANRAGSRLTRYTGVAFRETRLPHARFVGMPLRHEIESLDRHRTRPEALEFFGLSADR